MNRVLVRGGFLVLIISVILLWKTIEKKNILLNGIEIEARVVDIPVSCETSSKNLKPFFRFEYNNKEYTKNIKGSYCKTLEIGRLVKLKTNTENSIFVFTDENINKEFIFGFVLLLLGVICGFKGFKTQHSTLTT